MDIVFYFIASSMQDRRALVKHLLTMQISFFYDGDTERIMIDGIDETKADKIARGAKMWGTESPIRVEADYLTF
jgi:hypothetical protein